MGGGFVTCERAGVAETEMTDEGFVAFGGVTEILAESEPPTSIADVAELRPL